MKNGTWINRWRMRQIVASLSHATHHGMRPGVLGFAKSLEATALMSRDIKKDAAIHIRVTRRELNEFITYMTKLHVSKQSLLIRARIGLAVLCMTDKQILGETPEELVAREKTNTKSSNDNKVIQLSTKR